MENSQNNSLGFRSGFKVWIEEKSFTGEETLGFISGELQKEVRSGEWLVKIEDNENNGEVRNVKDINLHHRHETLKPVIDIMDLPVSNNAEIFNNLSKIYMNSSSYCYCGPSLVFINPYRRIDYEEAEETHNNVRKLFRDKKLDDAKPHIISITARALAQSLESLKPQSLIISGESGAGKTENSRRCIEFLSKFGINLSGSNLHSLINKISAGGIVLEAFGNAKTVLNDNSSRFGKLISMHVDQTTMEVERAKFSILLLEKSRVTHRNLGNRNFHIFYLSVKYLSNEKLKEFGLDKKPESIKALNPYYNLEGDQKLYNELIHAFNLFGFTTDILNTIWKTIAIVIHLCGIEIDSKRFSEGNTPCMIMPSDHLSFVLKLLNIEESDFTKLVTYKRREMHGEIIYSPLRPAHASAAVDSLARELYSQLFEFLTSRINKELRRGLDISEMPNTLLKLNVLDIFGFESMPDGNSLEQMLINFTNEKIHHLYIDYTFENEKKLLIEEGLNEYAKKVTYKDNQNVIKR